MTNASQLTKNTVLMYLRMLLLIVIGFVSSRVLLQKLGVDDFGLYGLVGSVIALFSSVRGMFVTSTQRFLNYEMGRGQDNNLNKVFNTSMIVNILIAAIFALTVEAVGLWFIRHEINLASGKMFDAEVVLHLSVATSVIYILTVPYDALLIAHENISTYASLSIIDNLLRLGIIFILDFVDSRLTSYALLLLIVALAMRIVYSVYCHRNYPECRINFRTDRQSLKQMTSFAGWQFFGNTAFTLTHNGLNMILNVFGGTACNAARSIAYQVNAAVNQLVTNMSLVLSPQSVKSFAANDKGRMMNLFYFSSKAMFLISCIAILPILIFTPELISLWLGTIPQYAVVFIQLMMYYSVIRALHSPVDTLFKSVGQIRKYQLLEGFVLAIPVPVAYILLRHGFPLFSAFALVAIFELVNLMLIVSLAGKLVDFDIRIYLKKILLPSLVCLAVAFLCERISIDRNYISKLSALLVSELFVILYVWASAFTKAERMAVKQQVRIIIKRETK